MKKRACALIVAGLLGCGPTKHKQPMTTMAPMKETCANATVTCGNTCVDLTSNTLHCGTCGNQCAVDQICNSGVCQLAQNTTGGNNGGGNGGNNGGNNGGINGGNNGGNKGGGGGNGCYDTVNCLTMCQETDDQCANDCLAAASKQGLTLLQALAECLDRACPLNGICANQSSTQCSNCVTTAYENACVDETEACVNNQ